MKLQLSIFLAVSLLVSCSSEKEESKIALAVVNEEEITREQFQYWWDRRDSLSDTKENRSALLEELIQREAMIQRAKEAGILDDIELQEQFRSLVISRLREKELNQEISVDEEALRSLYEENKDRFEVAAKSQVAVLWFQTRGLAPLEAQYRQRLENLLPQIAEVPVTEGFGSLSATNTEHRPSRYQGGVVGWIDSSMKQDPWRNAIREIAAQLKPGETSKVVTRKEGAFLVRLISRTEPGTKTFESVRPLLAGQVRQSQRQELEEQFQQDTLNSVQIERHLDRLNQIPLPTHDDETLTASQK